MSVTTPTPIEPLPPAPNPGLPQVEFDPVAYAWSTALPAWSEQVNAIAITVASNAAAALSALPAAAEAQEARDAAVAAADVAVPAAAEAVAAAGAAVPAAATASAARDSAEAWAEALHEIEPGRRSAKYWAEVAATVVSGGVIADTQTGLLHTWSSAKISAQLDTRAPRYDIAVIESVGPRSVAAWEHAVVVAAPVVITLPATPGTGDECRVTNAASADIAVTDGVTSWPVRRTATETYIFAGGLWHRVSAAAAAGPLPVVDHGEVASLGDATVELDIGGSDFHTLSMAAADATGALTISFNNIPDTAGARYSWHVRLRSGGRKPIVFSQPVAWSGGVAPTLGNGTDAYDVLMFYRIGDEVIRGMLIDAW